MVSLNKLLLRNNLLSSKINKKKFLNKRKKDKTIKIKSDFM